MQDILNGLDALLISNPINIRYLTSFVGASPEEREAFVLMGKTKNILFTNALYRQEAKALASPTLKIEEISRENPISKRIAVVSKALSIRRLGFEENNLTVAEAGTLGKQLKGVQLVPTEGRVERMRLMKREDEIAHIRAAARITDVCFDAIVANLKPGVKEAQIAWDIESFFRAKGAESAFSPIVAFGANSSMPHYKPEGDGATLAKRDIVLLDFGAQVGGYCADMTRVVFVGTPQDKWLHAYRVVLGAQLKALDYLATAKKRSGSTADRLARGEIKKSGFPLYPHGLGHGVGLAIHEAPRLTVKKNAALKKGMIVTVEPGVYEAGAYGIRIEDLVLLRKDGIEILSRSPKEVIIL
jgi:Xaa-Pro aminopeptidase